MFVGFCFLLVGVLAFVVWLDSKTDPLDDEEEV